MPTPTDTPTRAVRDDGWTPARRQQFFEALAAGHICKARRRDPAFAQACRVALETARRIALEASSRGFPKLAQDPVRVVNTM